MYFLLQAQSTDVSAGSIMLKANVSARELLTLFALLPAISWALPRKIQPIVVMSYFPGFNQKIQPIVVMSYFPGFNQ